MLLSASAARRPDRVAWIHGTACASYATTADRVARLAGGLRRSGIGAGDRLVLVMPNGPALFEVLWGRSGLATAAVPLNRHLHPREVAFVAEHSAATGIVLSEPTREAAGQLDQATRVIWDLNPRITASCQLARPCRSSTWTRTRRRGSSTPRAPPADPKARP